MISGARVGERGGLRSGGGQLLGRIIVHPVVDVHRAGVVVLPEGTDRDRAAIGRENNHAVVNGLHGLSQRLRHRNFAHIHLRPFRSRIERTDIARRIGIFEDRKVGGGVFQELFELGHHHRGPVHPQLVVAVVGDHFHPPVFICEHHPADIHVLLQNPAFPRIAVVQLFGPIKNRPLAQQVPGILLFAGPAPRPSFAPRGGVVLAPHQPGPHRFYHAPRRIPAVRQCGGPRPVGGTGVVNLGNQIPQNGETHTPPLGVGRINGSGSGQSD